MAIHNNYRKSVAPLTGRACCEITFLRSVFNQWTPIQTGQQVGVDIGGLPNPEHAQLGQVELLHRGTITARKHPFVSNRMQTGSIYPSRSLRPAIA